MTFNELVEKVRKLSEKVDVSNQGFLAVQISTSSLTANWILRGAYDVLDGELAFSDWHNY